MASFVIIANFSQLNFIIVCSFFFLCGVESPTFFKKIFTTQQNLLVLCKLFYSYFTAADRSHLFSANLISPQQQNTHLFSAIFFIFISPQQTEVTYSLQTLFHRSSRILTYSLQSFLHYFHKFINSVTTKYLMLTLLSNFKFLILYILKY